MEVRGFRRWKVRSGLSYRDKSSDVRQLRLSALHVAEHFIPTFLSFIKKLKRRGAPDLKKKNPAGKYRN